MDLNKDITTLHGEISGLLRRNAEEKQQVTFWLKQTNVVINKYKNFLDESKDVLEKARETLEKHMTPGDISPENRPSSVSPEEDRSSNFVSTESESKGSSFGPWYRGERLMLSGAKQDSSRVKRCFYKPQESSPPTTSEKESLTSLLNKPSPLAEDENDLHVDTIDQHFDMDASEKQFKYPYQLANGPKNELIISDRECHQLIVFSENLQPLFVFGKRGPGKGDFYNPTGLAVDAVGLHLYIADHNNIIQKFKIKYDEETLQLCKFKYVTQYGGKGGKEGQLACPCGLALSRSGSKLYICDFRNHRIQVFSTDDGRVLHVFGRHGKGNGEFDEPHSVAVNNNDDKIFVSDHSNNRIQVFTPQGEFITVIVDSTTSPNQPQMQYPRGIFYTLDGQLLVSCTYTHCVLEFKEDSNGKIVYKSTIKGIVQPGGIVKQHDGRIVVTSNVKQMLIDFTLQ